VRRRLDQLAQRKERILIGLSIDAVAIPALPLPTQASAVAEAPSGLAGDPPVVADLVWRVRRCLPRLRERTEELALLATINEWPMVERLWRRLLPDLKAVVANLGLLQECPTAAGVPAAARTVGLLEHLERLSAILVQLSHGLARENALELSDLLDQRLAPWLGELERLLTRAG